MVQILDAIMTKSQMFDHNLPKRKDFLYIIYILLLGLNRSLVHIAQSKSRTNKDLEFVFNQMEAFNFPYFDSSRSLFRSFRFVDNLDHLLKIQKYDLLDLPFGPHMPNFKSPQYQIVVHQWYDRLADFRGRRSIPDYAKFLVDSFKVVLLSTFPQESFRLG
jgi:hypothetical protein